MKSILNIKLNVLIFYVGYTIILANLMFQQVYSVVNILGIANIVCLGLLFFNCIINILKIKKKREMIILFVVIILAVITRIISNNSIILMLCLLIISFRNIKFEQIVKYDLCIKTLFLIIVVSCYFLNLTTVNLHYRDGVLRQSMGFSNPNTFSTYILSIVVEFLYLRRAKINIKDFIVIIMSICLINYYADSRTQIVCLIILATILFINKYLKKIVLNSKLINSIFNNAFLILTVLCLIIIVFYEQGNELVYSIDEATTGRIKIASEYLDVYDINLFGHNVEATSTTEDIVTLDNTYIFLLVSYGIVPLVIMCFFMRTYMKNTSIKNEEIIRIIMLVFLASGLMEKFCIRIQFNIFLLYFANILYNAEENIEDSDIGNNKITKL